MFDIKGWNGFQEMNWATFIETELACHQRIEMGFRTSRIMSSSRPNAVAVRLTVKNGRVIERVWVAESPA